MPGSQRYFAAGQLQFVTSSTYWRMKPFDSPCYAASSPRRTNAELRSAPPRPKWAAQSWK
jgi:hypothetical protein